jgi:hypothetical protein
MQPKHTLRFFLLRRHFRLRTVTALQWSESELLHVMGKEKCFSLHTRSYFTVVTASVNYVMQIVIVPFILKQSVFLPTLLWGS